MVENLTRHVQCHKAGKSQGQEMNLRRLTPKSLLSIRSLPDDLWPASPVTAYGQEIEKARPRKVLVCSLFIEDVFIPSYFKGELTREIECLSNY